MCSYSEISTCGQPQHWPRPQRLGLGLVALASTSASAFWPHLTSLVKSCKMGKVIRYQDQLAHASCLPMEMQTMHCHYLMRCWEFQSCSVHHSWVSGSVLYVWMSTRYGVVTDSHWTMSASDLPAEPTYTTWQGIQKLYWHHLNFCIVPIGDVNQQTWSTCDCDIIVWRKDCCMVDGC